MANYSGLKNPGLTNKYEKVTMLFYYDNSNVITSGDVYFNSPGYDLGVKDMGDSIGITVLLDKSKNITYQIGINNDGNRRHIFAKDYDDNNILYENLDTKFTFAQSVNFSVYLADGHVVFGPSASAVIAQHIAGNLPADKLWDCEEFFASSSGGDYYITFSNWNPNNYSASLLITPKHDFDIIDLCNYELA